MIKYVKEMFCDRIAACKIYLGKSYTDSAALDYFIRKKLKQKITILPKKYSSIMYHN